MNEELKGPIILWVNYGPEGWQPKSFNTIKEALEAPRYNYEIIVTKKLEYEVLEKTEEGIKKSTDGMNIQWDKSLPERENENG